MKNQTAQQHTPGPWGYDLNHTVGRHEGGEWIESVCQLPVGTHKRRPTRQEKADMRLIAAAPELLDALRLHLEFLSSVPKGWLGKTSGDIGALNDAYLTGNKALAKVEGKA